MGLITPDYGLLFWMLLSFGIVLYILRKFAWKPILQGIKNREEQISRSLREAEKAREEITKLQGLNAEMAAKARLERDAIMLEAKQLKDRMIKEATEKAQEETKKYLEQARITINREREVAQSEIKSYASSIALQVAEMIIRKEIANKQQYDDQIKMIIDEMATNN